MRLVGFCFVFKETDIIGLEGERQEGIGQI